MRPRFEQNLKAYSKVAKDELKLAEKNKESDGALVNLEMKNLRTVIDWHIEKAKESGQTDIQAQEDIYFIQKQKQEIIKKLESDLACLDNPECIFKKEENARSTSYEESTGFSYQNDRGKIAPASFGEILTDMEWGVYYNLDKNKTPRHLMKKYLVEKTKMQLGGLLDEQIIESEIGRVTPTSGVKLAYMAIKEKKEKGEGREQKGFVSESIVKTFLAKMSIDENLPFTIKPADVYQDVHQKIDFIISLKERNRGVNVETSEKNKDIGIQFSINNEAKTKKEEQIKKSVEILRRNKDEIQDIALVIFPLEMANSLKEKWERKGKPAGGPEKYLYRHVAKKLFSGLLKDIMPESEISKYWQKVESNFL
ncbi:MAG: hypothetical protein WDK96_02940 [Candidatus Paceibacterota bacterium]|jgi:hypothetical protein